MTKIWDDLDHRLSVVQRWGIAQSIHKQSVAEHVFNVERIAVRIAREWFGYDMCVNSGFFLQLILYAHHHDDLEAISGDIPTMVKPFIDEKALEVSHADLIPTPIPGNSDVKNIVKLADMLEGYWFLAVEHKLGNRYLDDHHSREPQRIVNFVVETWGHEAKLLKQVSNAIDDMDNEGSIRHSKRGR